MSKLLLYTHTHTQFFLKELGGKIQAGSSSHRLLCLLSINLKISNAILHRGAASAESSPLFTLLGFLNQSVLSSSLKEAPGRQRVNPPPHIPSISRMSP